MLQRHDKDNLSIAENSPSGSGVKRTVVCSFISIDVAQ
jgi:hypothetical protein